MHIHTDIIWLYHYSGNNILLMSFNVEVYSWGLLSQNQIYRVLIFVFLFSDSLFPIYITEYSFQVRTSVKVCFNLIQSSTSVCQLLEKVRSPNIGKIQLFQLNLNAYVDGLQRLINLILFEIMKCFVKNQLFQHAECLNTISLEINEQTIVIKLDRIRLIADICNGCEVSSLPWRSKG